MPRISRVAGSARNNAGHDLALAGLDAPRDLDLALARQERHLAHLAQIHAHRIVVAHGLHGGRLLRDGGLLVLDLAQLLEAFLRLLLAAEHLDVHHAEHAVDLVHLLHLELGLEVLRRAGT
jgi:hypothetical protein